MGQKMSSHIIPNSHIIEQDIGDICPICYDPLTENNSECIQKWNCSHKFHRGCIERWNKGCPLCRTLELLRPNIIRQNNRTNKINPLNTFDVNIMKTIHREVPEEYKSKYTTTWNDKCCIRENHNMLFIQPYGVLGICEDCNIIQCYCLNH
jgi:hypothetical protein